MSKEIVKQIKGLNYKDYSRLCKNLLVKLPVTNVNTGEIVGSVLDVMRNTNMNLQEIIFNPEFNFYETINSYNEKYYNAEKGDIDGYIEENAEDGDSDLFDDENIELDFEPDDDMFIEDDGLGDLDL